MGSGGSFFWLPIAEKRPENWSKIGPERPEKAPKSCSDGLRRPFSSVLGSLGASWGLLVPVGAGQEAANAKKPVFLQCFLGPPGGKGRKMRAVRAVRGGAGESPRTPT